MFREGWFLFLTGLAVEAIIEFTFHLLKLKIKNSIYKYGFDQNNNFSLFDNKNNIDNNSINLEVINLLN